MKKNIKNWVIILLMTTSLQSWVKAGTDLIGSQFTYQGELIDNGSPANGIYDVSVLLFKSLTGGSQIGEIAIVDIEIVNGLFTTIMDFGDVPFNGEEVYLELSIRPGDSSGPLEILSPRQRINATPYAIQSEFVENGSSPWYETDIGLIYTSGNIGIGQSVTNTTKLLVNVNDDNDPARFIVDGNIKLRVHNNGGTSLGSNMVPPANGLLINGPATQGVDQHGFLKAATEIQCGAGLNGGSLSFFNNVNGNDFTTTQNGAGGGCIITTPFNISNAFFTVSAYDTGGVSVFETVVASCSPISNNEIQCQLQKIGATTGVNNGVVQLAIY